MTIENKLMQVVDSANRLMEMVINKVTIIENKHQQMTPLLVPVGVPLPWPSTTPPAGFFKCDGSVFDKSQYPQLATVYPDGVLPDLRGEFIRGWDDGRGIDAGRSILSQQKGSLLTLDSSVTTVTTTGLYNLNIKPESEAKTYFGMDEVVNNDYSNAYFSGTAGTHGGISAYPDVFGVARPRNIAFLYIVRAA